MSKNEYKDLIFTNHALQRMKERGISYQQVWETYKHPDTSERLVPNGSVEMRKKFNQYEITVIYKPNDKKEVIVVSCWMEPPLPGSKDAKEKERYKKFKKSGFFGKLWLEILRQFNL